LIEWVRGYPFEVAKPEQVFEFFRDRGIKLLAMKTRGGGLGWQLARAGRNGWGFWRTALFHLRYFATTRG
jgi:hypothetical protein